MPAPRWNKVLRDLWGNRTRTLLVVLSIAVGVMAIGMVATTRVILARDLTGRYLAQNPASATLYISPGTDDEELVRSVQGMPGVGEVQGRQVFQARVQKGRDEWLSFQAIAIPDYSDIRIDKFQPISGAWPPAEREVLLERATLDTLKANVGDSILLETGDGKRRQLRVSGVVHDMNQLPAFFGGAPTGYVSFDTLEWLGAPRAFNQLGLTVAEDALDKNHIKQVTDRVTSKIESGGRLVYYTLILDPGKHPADTAIQALLFLLGVLGFASLLLSAFLVVNTIAALMAQQTRQIGMMKAIGARAGQLVGMYLVTVLMFSLLALAVGVPLGVLGAGGMSSFLVSLLNSDVTGVSVSPNVLALQAAVGLLVPLLAALYPVIAGVRITAREAMSSYGLGSAKAGRSRLGGLIERAPALLSALSRPLLLSLRNTFRRKGRLALTLTTLTLAGAIFMAVFSVRSSLLRTLDGAFEYFRYDIAVSFQRAYQDEQIERELLRVPGVAEAECLTAASVRRVRADESESANLIVFALEPSTDLIKPAILEGRWLDPRDESALVVNTEVLRLEPDIKVGDWITLKIYGRETSWRVVGLVRGDLLGPFTYASGPYLARLTGNTGRAYGAWVVTRQHDAASQTQIAKVLEERLKQAGLKVSGTDASSRHRMNAEMQFNVVVSLLLIMAVLLAVVGGLGLMGTMGLNVLERTREIGVMRAIGASDGAVRRIVMVEGILIGVLSWTLGALIALPSSKLLSDQTGIALVRAPLSYAFSVEGLVIWFVVVVFLAALASILPARSASRLTVREVLAYE